MDIGDDLAPVVDPIAPSMSFAHLRAPSLAFTRDPQFALALAAGPIAWLAAAAVLNVEPKPAWVLGDPLRYASLALAWPLVEEWVFRGALQPALARTDWGARGAWGVSTANVATSIVFASAHALAHTPAWAAATFVPSLVFGYFRDRHATYAPSIALHVFYNAGWFLLLTA